MSLYDDYLKSKPAAGASGDSAKGSLYDQYKASKEPKQGFFASLFGGGKKTDTTTPPAESASPEKSVVENGQALGFLPPKNTPNILDPKKTDFSVYSQYQAKQEGDKKTLLQRAKEGYDALGEAALYATENKMETVKNTGRAVGEFAESAFQSLDNFMIDVGNAVYNHTLVPVAEAVTGKKVNRMGGNEFKHDVAPGMEPASIAGNIVGGSVPYIVAGEALAPINAALALSSPLVRTVGTVLLNTAIPAAIQQVPPLQPGESHYSRFMQDLPSNLLSFGVGTLIPKKTLSALYTGLTQYGIGAAQGKDRVDNLTNALISSVFMLTGGHDQNKTETPAEVKARAEEIAKTDLGNNPHPQDVITKKTAENFLDMTPKQQSLFIDQSHSLIVKANEGITPDQVINDHLATASQVLDNPDTKVILGEHPKQYLTEVQDEIVRGLKGTAGKDFKAQADAVKALNPQSYGSVEEFGQAAHQAVQPVEAPVTRETTPAPDAGTDFKIPGSKLSPTEQMHQKMKESVAKPEEKPAEKPAEKKKALPTKEEPAKKAIVAEVKKYDTADEFVAKATEIFDNVRKYAGGDSATFKEKVPAEDIALRDKLVNYLKTPEVAKMYDRGMKDPEILKNLYETISTKTGKSGEIKQVKEPKNPVLSTDNKAPRGVVKSDRQVKLPAEKPIPEPKVPTEDLKTSGVAKSIAANAIKENLAKSFRGLAGYEGKTVVEQSAKVAEIIKDEALTRKIISGEEGLPHGVSGSMFIKGVEEYATKIRDVGMLRDLARSNVVAETSIHAQELGFLAQRDGQSPVEQIKKISKAREEAVKKKLGDTKVSEAKKEAVKDIKKSMEAKKPRKQEWSDFIKSIQC